MEFSSMDRIRPTDSSSRTPPFFWIAKKQHFERAALHKARGPQPLFFISPSLPKYCSHVASKKGNVRALWEVSQKQFIMKSNQVQKIATAQKNQKKENAQDIISKSNFKNHCLTRLFVDRL
jgi:hypothetical protein